MAFNLTLYGSDTDYTTSERPAIATLTGAVTPSTVALTAYQLKARPSYDIETTDAACGVTQTIVSGYMEFNIMLSYRRYTSTDKNITELFTEFPILTKKYLWIYSDNYGVGFKTANATLAVVLTGCTFEDLAADIFVTTITFRSRKPITA